MPILENEPDDLSLENETSSTAPPRGGNSPFLLAALGLALMLGGYAALNYVPLTPRQTEQERQLSELRDLAAKSHGQGTAVGALEGRLKQVEPPWRTPPYQLPGRLALFGGLFLFLAAGFLMYRKSPTSKIEPEE